MSKYCGNCGGQLDDSAKVCGFCGTPLETEEIANVPVASQVSTNDYTYSDPDKNQKIVKYGIFGGIAVVAVLVIVLLISFISNNTGYNAAVNTVMGVFEDGADFEIEDLEGMSSARYEDEDDFLDYYEDFFDQRVETFEDETDDDYDVSWEIKEVVELKEKDVKIFGEYLAMRYEDYDEDILTEVVAVQIKMTVEADDDDYKQKLTLVLGNEDGDWKLFDIYGAYDDLDDTIDSLKSQLD